MTAKAVAAPARWGPLAHRVGVWSVVGLFLAVGLGFALLGPAELAGGFWWMVLGWTAFPVVGALILSSRPGNAVGRVLLLIGLWWVLFGLGLQGADRVPSWAFTILSGLTNAVFLLLPLLVLVFPSGRVYTRLGRVLGWVMGVVAALFLTASLLHAEPLEAGYPVSPWGAPELLPVTRFVVDTGFIVVPALMVAALVDLVLRWRRSVGVERLQFRWFAYGVIVTILMLAISESAPDAGPLEGFIVTLNAIPVCIGIAVTRHGLYEIGRVVSRTVSYAIVTALVVAVYALVVTLASRLLPDQSTLAVAAATLAAAGVFLPALRWLRRIVDRRFDRERYDAAQVVDAFGARLQAAVDPELTSTDLVAAVEHTLQPAAVGLWTAGLRTDGVAR